MNRVMISWATAFIVTIGTSALLPVRRGLVQSPCRVGGDTGTLAINVVKNALAASDSAGELEPVDVNAAMVSDSATCQSIVDSYNSARFGSDSILRVSSGFIVRAVIPTADTGYAMYLPASVGPPTRVEELIHFDKTFHLLLIQSGLE